MSRRTVSPAVLLLFIIVLSVDLMGCPRVPAITSFVINNGAEIAVSRTVTLNHSALGAPDQYVASALSDLTGSLWQPYSRAPLYVIASSGEGPKTVYFTLRNDNGLSATASDTILLDENNDGEIHWTKKIGGAKRDFAYDAKPLGGRGAIVVGQTNSMGNGSYDIYVIRTKSDGSIDSAITIGDVGLESASAVESLGNDDAVIAGSTDSYGVDKSAAFVLRVMAMVTLSGKGQSTSQATMERKACV